MFSAPVVSYFWSLDTMRVFASGVYYRSVPWVVQLVWPKCAFFFQIDKSCFGRTKVVLLMC